MSNSIVTRVVRIKVLLALLLSLPFTALGNESEMGMSSNDTRNINDALNAQDRGDFVSALRIFQSLAEDGDDRALFNLGLMYRHGRGVPQNNQLAVEYYWRSADKGNQFAQYSLGFLYDIGEGVEQNYERAAYWYLKSAEQGNEDAEFNLANMYREGQGVKKDLAKAFSEKRGEKSPKYTWIA